MEVNSGGYTNKWSKIKPVKILSCAVRCLVAVNDFLLTIKCCQTKRCRHFFVFYGTATLFLQIIYSLVTSAKREAILFLFGCSEVNSTWLITSELANQRARKTLFTCVVYTNRLYLLLNLAGAAPNCPI